MLLGVARTVLPPCSPSRLAFSFGCRSDATLTASSARSQKYAARSGIDSLIVFVVPQLAGDVSVHFLTGSTSTFLRPKHTIRGALTGRNGLLDLLGLLAVHLEGEQVLGGSQLELGHVGLLNSLDDNSIAVQLVLLLTSHDLNELFQILDFSGHFFVP